MDIQPQPAFIIAIIWGLFVTLFWMYVAYRAMKAHEKIADAQSDLTRKLDRVIEHLETR